jgi:microcystin-dependent protein
MSSAYVYLIAGRQFSDQYGNVAAGALARLYLGNTTSPIIAYSDPLLSTPITQPVVANAAGYFPSVFIDDTPETIRVVVSTATGVALIDQDGVPVVGPSRWASAAPVEIDTTALARTGVMWFIPENGTLEGWFRLNGRTIGSATSGATERANADCEAAFAYLWSKFPSLTVSGGRGANAAADWAANKNIATLDMRGRGPFGLDTMGNSAASVLPGITTGGTTGGASTVTLTESTIPAHAHGGTAQSAGAHTHAPLGGGSFFQAFAGGASGITTGGSFGPLGVPATTSENGAHTHTLSITATGGGQAHENMSPYLAGTWLMKL